MKNSPMMKAILVATMSMLTMVGCANNKDSGGARVRNGNGSTPTNMAGMTVGNLVYNTSVTGSNASTAARGLLIASVPDGTAIGSVDNNTGMSITGKVHFDTSVPSQNMQSYQSYVELKIMDSYAVSNPSQYGPFLISVGMNNSGMGTLTYNSSSGKYQAKMVFQDSFGWIYIDGTMDPTNLTGRVYYGSGDFNSAPVWTYLGDFTTQSCGGFFTCQ